MHISGGVSNVSFSFRGNDVVREAIHAVFLYHAIQAGLDMGIVNAGQLAVYEDIEPRLKELVEDVHPQSPAGRDRAARRARRNDQRARAARRPRPTRPGATQPVEERLKHAILKGIVKYIDEDTEEARQKYAVVPGDHRRPADGRHERRRRPVRRRQDVPAAGGEDRPA